MSEQSHLSGLQGANVGNRKMKKKSEESGEFWDIEREEIRPWKGKEGARQKRMVLIITYTSLPFLCYVCTFHSIGHTFSSLFFYMHMSLFPRREMKTDWLIAETQKSTFLKKWVRNKNSSHNFFSWFFLSGSWEDLL